MERREGFFNRKAAFATGFLLSFALLATLIIVQAVNRSRHMSSERSAGLASVAESELQPGWDPISLWSSPRLVDYVLPLPYPRGAMLQLGALPESDAKVIRSGTLWLIVSDIPRATEQVAAVAHQFGGFTAQSQAQLRAGEEQGA